LPGGVSHVTPAQGSPWQAPLAHPFAQLRSLGAYEQTPWLQLDFDDE
jgi:hypothetical protein